MAKPKLRRGLADFDEELRRLHITGQWKYDEFISQRIDGPEPRGEGYLWRWKNVYPKLLEACEVIPESRSARRSLLFNNPAIPTGGTTHTLRMGIQMIRPGEVAWAHRHTMAAIRFVIQGDGSVTTVVDGRACPMEDYDLILTPQWSWHDHRNRADQATIWLDALDAPLILSLNLPFYEPYPGDQVQPLRQERGKETPFLRYRWKDIEPQLEALARAPGSAYDGAALEYLDPRSGSSTLPTLGYWIQMLRPGEKTKRHRHTSSAMYFAVRGRGKTVVGDKTLEWEKHDSFVVPNWAWHEHVNRSSHDEAILFSVNDIPVARAFGLYREEPENSLDAVKAAALPDAGA